MSEIYEVGLFEHRSGSVSMLGVSSDPELIERVRTQIAAERTRELAAITPPVRIVEPADET